MISHSVGVSAIGPLSPSKNLISAVKCVGVAIYPGALGVRTHGESN